MPIMNGFETALKVKELYPQVKILAYSTNTSKKTIADILNSGADDFMFKGDSPDQLKQALERLYNSTSKTEL